ncbi:MAG: hypothetical protein D6E12_07020 [Desulfovibrio sp.]|nr:MAG: hypothetical protein D6E12_07020 [Desulfovibrio sp.]
MLRYFLVVALIILSVWSYTQHQKLVRLQAKVDEYQQEYWTSEIGLARTEGAFIGLRTSSEIKIINLRSAVTGFEQTVAELRDLVVSKDHLISSLQEGQMLTVTAYSPTPDQTDDTPFITANNNRVRPGIAAVSPDLFANGWVFGRKIYVVDYGVYEIDDLMAQRMQNTIDIFMFSRQEALTFGKQQLRVYLLGA